MNNWLDIDRIGLAKTLAQRGGEGSGRVGMGWLLFELLQNAWDTNADNVHVKVTPVKGRPLVEIEVTDDDHEGFIDLKHAYTMFAESPKKDDPEKRGRWDAGEKYVLSLCEEAKIVSTKGSVIFDKDGRRSGREKTEKGSVVRCLVRMTREEHDQLLAATRLLIPPHEKRTYVNDEELVAPARVQGFRVTLPTVKGDADGFLRRTRRETLVQLHECNDGTPMLYEMGIPVVELMGGEPWNIDIHQRVPLNADRDNVTPAYLRELRTAMLNHMHKHIKGESDATKAWVRDAAGDPDASKAAVEHVATERFGEKKVIFDPSDPQGTKDAMAQGYTVIPGGSLSKGEWDNIKRDGIILPAGQVTPSRPERTAATKVLGLDEETPGMKALKKLTSDLSLPLIGYAVYPCFISSPEATTLASWGGGVIHFNVPRLGNAFFETGPTEAQVDLIVHELGHSFEGDHLSKEYNDALTKLAAKLAFFIADNPTFFKEHSW